MSGKGPRRPKGESGAATSRLAANRTSSSTFTDPNAKDALVDSFLRGAALPTAPAGTADTLAQPLRTVMKRSETTKLKALAEIEAALLLDGPSTMADDVLIPYISTIAEVFRQTIAHEVPGVRIGACKVMSVLLDRSREVKQLLAPELSAILGPWLGLCGDVSPEVASAGRASLDKLFTTPEKLAGTLQRLRKPVMAFITHAVQESMVKALPSDSADPRVNLFVSALGALQLIVSQTPTDEASIGAEALQYALDASPLPSAVPQSQGARGGPLGKSTPARVALLRLLNAVALAASERGDAQQLLVRAATLGCFDRDPTMASAAWSSLLSWMRTPAVSVGMPTPWEDVVARVAEVIGERPSEGDDVLRAETILSSLFPFVIIAKRAARWSNEATMRLCDSLQLSAEWSVPMSLRSARAITGIELWSSMAPASGEHLPLLLAATAAAPTKKVTDVGTALAKGIKRSGVSFGNVLGAVVSRSPDLAYALADSRALAGADKLSGSAIASLCESVQSEEHVRSLQRMTEGQPEAAESIAALAAKHVEDRLPLRDAFGLALLANSGALLLKLPQDVRARVCSEDSGRQLVDLATRRGMVLPDCLNASVANTAAEAVVGGQWSDVCAVIERAEPEVVADVVGRMRKTVAGSQSISQLLGLIPVLSAVAAREQPESMNSLMQLMQALPAKLLEVVPSWNPLAYADAELEDDADDDSTEADEDEDEGSDASDSAADDDEKADLDSADNEATADEDMSASEALAKTRSFISEFAALCERVPGAGALPAELALKLEEATMSAEGDDACADGRPDLDCTVAAIEGAALQDTCKLLDGEALLSLAEDCVADLEEAAPQQLAAACERGHYSRHTLRQHLFLRPTAALGQALCGCSVLLAADASLSMRSAGAAAHALALCHGVQNVLPEKCLTALRNVARSTMRLPQAATALVAVCQSNPSLAQAALAIGSFGGDQSTESAIAIASHGVTRCLLPDSDATVSGAIAAIETVTLRNPDAQLQVEKDQLLRAVDKSSRADVIALALKALRHSAGISAPPLNGAFCRRLVELRDSARRVDASHVSAFGESLCLPCRDAGLSRDVCVESERCLIKAYQLHHLPTNGKLGQRPPHVKALAPDALRRLTMSMRQMRSGIAHHSAVFGQSSGVLDSLRASSSLVIFDISCECILRLKSAGAAEVIDLSDALVDVANCLAGVQRHEIKTLRASPSAVDTIAKLVVSLHFWLCSRTNKLLAEEIGERELQSIVAFTNRLACVVLTDTSHPSALLPMLQVIARAPVRSLAKRTGSEMGDVKPRDVTRHMKNCFATVKSRLTLLTYFGCWYACLSNEAGVVAAAREAERDHNTSVAVESSDAVIQLLDVILAACHARPLIAPRSGRRTFLSDAPDNLGFDFERLGEVVDAPGVAAINDHLATCGIAVLALALQRRAVRYARDWCGSLARVLRVSFEGFVGRFLSPALIQVALQDVLAQSPGGSTKFEPEGFDGLQVSVSETDRVVAAKFTADETSVEVKFILPACYPLQPATVDRDSIKTRTRVGVPAEKWRAWMMQASVKLVGGGSTVWQSISTIATNIQSLVDGVEPCPICYSVISPSNQKLPELSCVVCKNAKFHAHCLYEWWGNSGQTSCPMCRSPWFSS